MKVRILTGVIGFPIVFILLFLGGAYLKFSTMVLSLIGMNEVYRSLSKNNNDSNSNIYLLGYFFCIIYYLLLNRIDYGYSFILMIIFMLVLFIYLTIFNTTTNIFHVMTTFFGFIYVAVLLSFIYLVRELEFGFYYVWLIFICSWGCDTMAYFTGVFFGKHKLVPNLSYKKTVEGAIGGILGSIIITLIYMSLVLKSLNVDNQIILYKFLGISFIATLFSQFGDLSASSIKRYSNIKDYSNLLPGHGGVLDRFDSVLFSAPVVYILLLSF